MLLYNTVPSKAYACAPLTPTPLLMDVTKRTLAASDVRRPSSRVWDMSEVYNPMYLTASHLKFLGALEFGTCLRCV
eukprot:1179109-Prorocentrum_minimum.AAC.2